MIEVSPFDGIKAGVGLWLHRKDTVDDDVGREVVVEFVAELFAVAEVEALGQVEVGVVAGAVDTRVGTPAAGDGNAVAMQQQRQSPFQCLLH